MINILTASARRLVIAAALLATAYGMAFAQSAEPSRPYLKHDVTVSSNLVRIGDLIENAGIVANVAIFRAPDLGVTGSVSVEDIIDAVRPHSLVGFDTGGATSVSVTRASREIPISDVERNIAEALSTRFNIGAVPDIAIAFDRDPRALQVDPAAQGGVSIARLTYDARNGRFDAALEIPTSATQRGVLRLSGRAYATIQVVTITHPIDRGTVLKMSDVSLERRPRAEAGQDVVVRIDRAVGLAARNSLRPGQPLRVADLTRPEIVQRDQMVTLVFEAPGLTLTMRGKATEAGAEGDTVSVLNEQSKRLVQGVVAGPGHVVVTSAPRFTTRVASTTVAGQNQ